MSLAVVVFVYEHVWNVSFISCLAVDPFSVCICTFCVHVSSLSIHLLYTVFQEKRLPFYFLNNSVKI